MNIKKTTVFLCLPCILFVFLFSQEGNEYTSPTIGILRYVPAGAFQRDENPDNISVVSAFRMSEKEITREQFVAVTGMEDPSYEKVSLGENNPVQKVSWYQTIVFCNKLSMLEGLTPVYIIDGSTDPVYWGAVPRDVSAKWDNVKANWNANGYRLPTEMEWLWAAMGADVENPGQPNKNGYKKDFAGSNGSNSIDEYVWYSQNSNGCTHPVGTKLPNELGIYDLSGNVLEWCWDWYSHVDIRGTVVNYKGATSGKYRIHRGGSWFYGVYHARPSYSFDRFSIAYNENYSLGFRVVRK